MTPGPTRHAVAHVQDSASTFYRFITPAFEKIILEMTNLQGFRKYGDNWKKMDEIDLRAYYIHYRYENKNVSDFHCSFYIAVISLIYVIIFCDTDTNY
jgi:hypothetical protein